MPKQEFEVKTFRVIYICDECGIGELSLYETQGGQGHTRYNHFCQHCGARKAVINEYFPRIEYRRIK